MKYGITLLIAALFVWISAVSAQDFLSENGKPLTREQSIQRIITASEKECRDLIPAIARLLGNKDLSHAARYFLERINDPKATEALRTALTEVKDPLLLTGILNSIGMKEDAQSSDAIKPFLDHSNLTIAHAAALALGKIADDRAKNILLDAWLKAEVERKDAFGFGMVTLAALLNKKGNKASSAAVYQNMIKLTDVPVYWKIVAFEGLLPLLVGQEKIDLLNDIAESDNPKIVQILFSAARLESDRSVYLSTIMNKFESFNLRNKLAAVQFLAETDTSAIRDFILSLIQSDSVDSDVRECALSGLGRIGNLQTAQALLLEKPDPKYFKIVVSMPDPAINSFVLDHLKKRSLSNRALWIQLAAGRKITAALDIFREDLNAKDKEIQNAAILAAGSTGSLEEIGSLLDQANQENSKLVFDSVRALALGSNDPEKSAAAIASRFDHCPSDLQILLLDLFGEIRGKKALETVLKTIGTTDSVLSDNGVRVLASWKSNDCAPYLVYLAKNHPNGKFRTRALRGYIRILKLSTENNDKRLSLCQEAFSLSTRTDERALAIEAMGRIPSENALRQVVQFFSDDALRGHAYNAAVNIIEHLSDPLSSYAKDTLKKVYAVTINKDLKIRIAKIQTTRCK